MLVYAVIFAFVSLSLTLWVWSYLRNHCLKCRKRTNWGKYDVCQECRAGHEARTRELEEEREKRTRAEVYEMLERPKADRKEFGFSERDFLDVPCALCTSGAPKTHREIMRERGFSGDHKKCWDFVWNTHFSLSQKAHKERESRKFWKRWLYVPPSKGEAGAIGYIRYEAETIMRIRWTLWMLQNTLSAGHENPACLREYASCVEKSDHWMDMTTKQLLERRLSHLKNALGRANN